MTATVTYYPFGKALTVDYHTLSDALKGIEYYHPLTSGIADYELRVRDDK
jgi:hypothetical protein